MRVTARISKGFERAGHLKAYATIYLDNSFLVTDIRVVEREKGLRVFMPSTMKMDGKYHDICFSTSSELQKKIETAVLNAYDAFVKETESDD